MTQVNLSLKEIYDKLCPTCKEAMVVLVKDKLTDQAIRESLDVAKSIPNSEGK